MKKILWIQILILIIPSIGAVSWSAEAGTGYRANTAMRVDELRFFDAGFSVGSFSLYARSHCLYANDISAEYMLQHGKHASSRFTAHSQYVTGEGGFSDVGYMAGAGIGYDHFWFSIGLGIQGGIAYSEHSEGVLYSLSPLVYAGISLSFSRIRMELYMDMASRYEHLWKASTLFGLCLEAYIDAHSSISADLYMQSAEYLIDPYFRPYSTAVRLSYKYRVEQ